MIGVKKTFSLMIMGVTGIAALSGCRTINDPSFMPYGYLYHNDEYKAPPGPDANSLGYDYSDVKNKDVLARWQDAVAALVQSLEMQSGLTPRAVYIMPTTERTAFTSTFDYTLREELVARGYRPVASAENVTVIELEAIDPEKPEPRKQMVFNDDMERTRDPQYQEKMKYKGYILGLTAYENNVPIGRGSGVYTLPGYGYEYAQEQTLIYKRPQE